MVKIHVHDLVPNERVCPPPTQAVTPLTMSDGGCKPLKHLEVDGPAVNT